MTTGWFSKTAIDTATTMLTEPFVHDFVRANIWHVRGRDADLLVDTGMGIVPLAPHIDTPAGKPLLVVATHIHLDHVGSLHEFALRAGPAHSAADFATMPDAATYADMFRDLAGAVARLPDRMAVRDYPIEPAPLRRTLAEGDTWTSVTGASGPAPAGPFAGLDRPVRRGRRVVLRVTRSTIQTSSTTCRIPIARRTGQPCGGCSTCRSASSMAATGQVSTAAGCAKSPPIT